MNFVLDASVALAWVFEDEGGAYAVDVLEGLPGSEAVVASRVCCWRFRWWSIP